MIPALTREIKSLVAPSRVNEKEEQEKVEEEEEERGKELEGAEEERLSTISA